MIKNIHITNFKGIKDTVTLELKPITLLFGPNSAGKSSILHAFHYALEILERKNFDPYNTKLGGKSVELGGFKNLVHDHDLSKKITLKFDIELANTEIPVLSNYNFDKAFGDTVRDILENAENNDYYIEDLERLTNSRIDIVDYVESIHQKSKTAYISFSIEWLNSIQRADVSEIEFGLDEEILMRVSIDKIDSAGRIYPKISYINFDHPNHKKFGDSWEELFNDVTGGGDSKEQNILIKEWNSVMPNWAVGIILPYEHYKGSIDDENLEYEVFNYLEILCRLTVGLGNLLISDLKKFTYIGPIRDIPPRQFEKHFIGENERWANGLAAWDLIYSKKIEPSQINKWFEKLKINYELKVLETLRLNLSKDQLLELKEKVKSEVYRSIEYSFDEANEINELMDGEENEIFEVEEGSILDFYKRISTNIDDLFEIILNKSKSLVDVILEDKKRGVELKPYDLGVGISQLIPVIVGSINQKESILAIEQPEIHLHPAVQVEMADMFISQINEKPNVIYLLETHSEHLMLRFLRRIRNSNNNELTKYLLRNDQIVVFFTELSDEDTLSITKLKINSQGKFSTRWPKGFFEERHEELFG